jgi:hypothetical protein
MNTISKHGLRLARRAYLRFAPEREPHELAPPSITHQAASDLIKERLLSDAPLMIARFGAVELNCLLQYRSISDESAVLRKSLAYVSGRAPAFWWEESTLDAMTRNAGFFPRDSSLLERFSRQMLNDIHEVDVLGSWLNGERLMEARLRDAVRVRLRDLEPYFHRDPWAEALAGKVVLVVHPFAESITRQYARRSSLFADPRVLPDFELKTLKAVQTIAGSPTDFSTWFDAYGYMSDEIANTAFDVAILGCGAYGFPLSAHVKRLGKKGIQLGGASQILFGIKGKRWDEHEFISRLYNESWVRPLASERPDSYLSVEGGCYW